MSSSQSTESRGVWLWRKMAAVFGARFLDMWRDVDPVDVQAEWSHALHGMSRDALQRGTTALWHMRYPPTLPEFLEACRGQSSTVPALTDDSNRTPSVEARAQLAGIADAVSTAMHQRSGDHVAWARLLIARHERGESITSRQLQHAREAIAVWDTTHGTAQPQGEGEPIREPEARPTREPGCDDEEVAA